MAEVLDNFPQYPGLVVRPEVISFEDVAEAAPALAKHPKLVKKIMHWLSIDEVNAVHSKWCKDPGPEFARHLIEDDFKTPLRVDNEEILDRFPEGAFITVSNHPFGSIDGISLINLVTRHRPKFKVMVNMILGKISAMKPNFIAVDAWHSDDPAKKMVSVNGIRQALKQLKEGEPMGFFPAGAISITDRHGFPIDRPWQKSILEIIARSKVPVIPIYFHGTNRPLFNLMGHINWMLRTIMLPSELFAKRGKEIHISIGEPIMPEEQAKFKGDVEGLGNFLREKTYALYDKYK